jgi:hypothetical protein
VFCGQTIVPSFLFCETESDQIDTDFFVNPIAALKLDGHVSTIVAVRQGLT